MQQTDRKTRLSELRHKLAQLSDAEKQALQARGIIATVEGRTLSLHNTYMVYIQCNGQTPSVVGGYKQWKRAGRQVIKGQHGMTILFPAGEKDKETGDIIHADRFYAATIFDISQTESIDTPEVKETSAPAPAKGDTARADYRVSGIKKSNEYKHTYNISPDCKPKDVEKISKQLEAVDKYNYSKPSQPYPVTRYPVILGINNQGPAQPYGDIEIMVNGEPGLSLNDDNKPGEVKKFMKSTS